MSCLIKNIDEFCKNFNSVSFNSGSFNSTTVEVDLIGAKDEADLSGDLFSLKNNFGNVLPFLEEEFRVLKVKSSKSESGVSTKYSLQDHYSFMASNYMIGLNGRIGGDVMIGQEYYNVRGFPDPNGQGIPVDWIIERDRLSSIYNQVKDGAYYFSSSGSIKSNPNHWTNKKGEPGLGGLAGNVPDPNMTHGEVMYHFHQLLSQSPLPFPWDDVKNKVNLNALFQETGSFFEVVNSILSRYSLVFVANPFLGGFHVHDLSNDFGKINVLQNAGVTIPDSAISSSIEKDISSGYSTGAFHRGYSDGVEPPETENLTGGNTHSSEVRFRKSDADDMDHIFLLDRAFDMLNVEMDDGYNYALPASKAGFGVQFAKERMHEAGFGQEFELAKGAYTGDFGIVNLNGETENDREKLLGYFSEFKDQEGEFSPNDFSIFGQSQDLVEWVDSWGRDPDGINSPHPIINCSLNRHVSGGRTHPSVLEYYLKNHQRWQIKTHWGEAGSAGTTRAITQHGDITGFAAGGDHSNQVFSFETLGTAWQPVGSKNWSCDEGSEISFQPVLNNLAQSPFSFFSDIGGSVYDGKTVKDFIFGGNGLGKAVSGSSFPTLPSDFRDAGVEHQQGMIITDKGEWPVASYQADVEKVFSGWGYEPSYYNEGNIAHTNEDYNRGLLIFPLYQGVPIVFRMFDELMEVGKSLYEAADRDLVWNGVESLDTIRYYGEGSELRPTATLVHEYGTNYGHSSCPPNCLPGQVSSWKFNEPGRPPVSGSETNPIHSQKILKYQSFQGQPGCIHPNRRLQTFSSQYSQAFSQNGNNRTLYLDNDGKMNLFAWNMFSRKGPVCVEYLDKISFTLIGELIDFSHNDWKNSKKYLESFSVNVSGGTLNASYVFSQKAMLPDYLGLSAIQTSWQNTLF